MKGIDGRRRKRTRNRSQSQLISQSILCYMVSYPVGSHVIYSFIKQWRAISDIKRWMCVQYSTVQLHVPRYSVSRKCVWLWRRES